MKVIMPLGEVPVDAMVTKVTGQNIYTVKDAVVIFGSPDQSIVAEPGVRFLLNQQGHIHAMSSATAVVWAVNVEDLYEYLRVIVEDEQ